MLISMREQAGFHRITVVFHQGSGRGKGLSRASALRSRLDPEAHHITLLDITQSSPQNLHATLRSSDAVVVVGGDGLIHRVLPFLVDVGIPLGIIPAGSGNDAWRMSGACSVEQSIERVVDFISGYGRIRLADLLQVIYARNPEETKYVLGAVSCGFEALVNEKANLLPRWLSATRYVIALLISLPALGGRAIALDSPEIQFHGKVFVASISNIRSLGGGIELFPQAADDDGLADVLLIPETPLLRILPAVGKILRGTAHRHQRTARTPVVQVKFAGTSFGDGEPLGEGDFSVTVRPGSLTLMDLSFGDTH